MKSLVLCPCGHTMDRHDGDGCLGERSRLCACVRNQEQVLDAAIDEARSDPLHWPLVLQKVPAESG